MNSGKAKTKVMLIPSQATEGFGSVEGVETRWVSPNNNPTQERPITEFDKTYQVWYPATMNKFWTSEDDAFIRENYGILGVKKCAIHLGRTPGSVANRACRIGCGRMKGKTLVARKHRGYIQIAIGSYRAQLHRLIAEMVLGRPLSKGEVVHHKNGNTLDNRPENIEVLTVAEHQRRHWGENCNGRRDSKTGRFTHGE